MQILCKELSAHAWGNLVDSIAMLPSGGRVGRLKSSLQLIACLQPFSWAVAGCELENYRQLLGCRELCSKSKAASATIIS